MIGRKSITDLRLLILLLFLIILVPALSLTAFRYRQDHKNRVQELREEVGYYSELIALDNQRVFDGARSLLILLARSRRLNDPNTCTPFLRELLPQYPGYSGLSVADLDGSLYCASGAPPHSPVNHFSSSFFQKAIQTRGFAIGEFRVGARISVPLVHCAYPVFDEAGQVRAIAIAIVPLAQTDNVFKIIQSMPQQNYTLTMVTPTGVVLAHHQPTSGEWAVGEGVPELQFAEKVLSDTTRVFDGRGPNGETFIYASSPVQISPGSNRFHVILGFSQDPAMAKINQDFRSSIITLLAVSFVGLFLAMIAAYGYVLRPVDALVETSKQLEEGNLSARSTVPYEKAQLGQLAHAFDSMAVSLERRSEERAKAEAMFRSILETDPDARVIVDRSGNIALVNTQTENLFGYSCRELIGKSVELLIPERFRQRHIDHRKMFHAKPEFRPMGKNLELFGLRSDGTEFPVEISLSVLEMEEGVFASVAIRDITDRKRASDQLRLAVHHLSEAQRISHVGSWEWDPATNATEQSEEMCRILGIAIDERRMSFERFLELVHPDDRELLTKALEESLRANKPFDFDFRVVRPDGSERILHSEATAYFEADGQPIRMVGTDQDITERKRAEALLQQATSQLSLFAGHLHNVREEERTRISRDIHDELGQSLSGLMMDLYGISRRIPKTEPELAEKVQESIQHVNYIIRDIQRISAELRPRALDLGLMTAIEWQLEEFQSRSGIHCELTIPASDIKFNEERCLALFRIVQEALTNIARHSGATQAEVILRQVNNDLLLEIHDNGKGLDNQETEHHKSLGITSMRERALLLGGTFDIQTSHGQGTTVRVLIPISV